VKGCLSTHGWDYGLTALRIRSCASGIQTVSSRSARASLPTPAQRRSNAIDTKPVTDVVGSTGSSTAPSRLS
jgi:hypothetical protein